MTMKRHWYFLHIHECPVCGKGKTYRVRKYTRKPKNAAKRYDFTEDYDYCMEFS